MATISSPGIGSGLDIKSIVSQLVALEKQPLTNLKLQATTVQTKISTYGQIQSLVSTLSDTVGNLASVTGWNAMNAASSNSNAVSASAIGGTQPTSFSVEVQTLAKAQNTASAAILPVGGPIGAGTLSLAIGKWSGAPATFAIGSAAAVDIAISATDTVSDVASKINGANAGVNASVLSDATGERLLLRSKATGVNAGFQLSVSSDADGLPADAAGLSRLVTGNTMTQATDAAATVNGIAVSSATNTFDKTIAGVTFTASQITTAPVDISISQDNSSILSNVNDFVKAYNALNDVLNDATKYDAATKTAGLFQGDSSTLGMQSALHAAVQAVTTGSKVFHRLADVGITQLRGGDLTVDGTKLNAAMANRDEMKALFRNNGGGAADGIAVKLKTLSSNMLSSSGFFKLRNDSYQAELDRNAKEQARVNTHASDVEAQLNLKYGALDAKMSSLNALNAYITQQVAAWNKPGA
jgi:flagellar hook-associated protein 2